MTQEREKELRDEWDKIRRDLGHEHREIADYWLTIMKSEINKVLEGVEKDANEVKYVSDDLAGDFAVSSFDLNEIINKYKQ